jgi:hypothetical protein
MRRNSQASGSFLKKRTKKLLALAGYGTSIATARGNQNFFASFFVKKEAPAYPPSLALHHLGPKRL